MDELRALAKKLLADGEVRVVIGWQEARHGVRPAFATNAVEADRLVFDHRAVHNLATYLSPRRSGVVRLGKAACVVKGCDLKAVAGLIREGQVKREELVLIGVRCGGVAERPTSGTLDAETVADRCGHCQARDPSSARVDHVVGAASPEPPGKAKGRDAAVDELLAKTPGERFSFWMGELSRCVRCHACREVCPMCFCERCVADKSQPQWIESTSHPRANLAWQLNRVQHLAGRCVECGECERACPAEIPLGLIMRHVARRVEARFEYRPTDDPGVPAPVGAFRRDDPEEFIR